MVTNNSLPQKVSSFNSCHVAHCVQRVHEERESAVRARELDGRSDKPTRTMSAFEHLQTEFSQRASQDENVLRTGEGVDLSAWLQQRISSLGSSAIPSLNAVRADAVADGELVRFCGMVQDVHDPEFYEGAYEVVGADGVQRVRTTKYQGCVSEEAGGNQIR